MTLKECRKVYRDWVSGLYGACTFRAAMRTVVVIRRMRENRIRMWNSEPIAAMRGF